MFNDISPEGYQSPLLPFPAPTQQQQDAKDREETLSQLPLLKEVVKHLDKRIAATDSIKESRRIAESHNILPEVAEVVLLELHKMLETERGYIQGRVDRAK